MPKTRRFLDNGAKKNYVRDGSYYFKRKQFIIEQTSNDIEYKKEKFDFNKIKFDFLDWDIIFLLIIVSLFGDIIVLGAVCIFIIVKKEI